MTPEDRLALERARQQLETPSLALRLTSLLGAPLEGALLALPPPWLQTIHTVSRASLERALQVACWTLAEEAPDTPPRNRLHQGVAAVSGAVGGSMGMVALPVELPLSTAIMMRSIAAIARSQGEPVGSPETAVACLEVFALGPHGTPEEVAGQTYFTIRAGLARAVADASRHIGRHGVATQGAPALVRLIASISARFGVVVSQKVAAQSVPLIGGLGGAVINAAFIDFYQKMAEGHFVVRRLQRQYGTDVVKEAYGALAPPLLPSEP